MKRSEAADSSPDSLNPPYKRREEMDERGITPVIPNRYNRKQPFSFSKRLYKLREQSARKQATEMGEPRAERRLAAMFAGDGAGYSRLVGADEESTRARLNAHRR